MPVSMIAHRAKINIRAIPTMPTNTFDEISVRLNSIPLRSLTMDRCLPTSRTDWIVMRDAYSMHNVESKILWQRSQDSYPWDYYRVFSDRTGFDTDSFVQSRHDPRPPPLAAARCRLDSPRPWLYRYVLPHHPACHTSNRVRERLSFRKEIDLPDGCSSFAGSIRCLIGDCFFLPFDHLPYYSSYSPHASCHSFDVIYKNASTDEEFSSAQWWGCPSLGAVAEHTSDRNVSWREMKKQTHTHIRHPAPRCIHAKVDPSCLIKWDYRVQSLIMYK